MALIPVWNLSYYSYTSKTLLRLCAAIMQWSHSAKLLTVGSRLTATTVCRPVLLLSHAFISTREGICMLETVHTYILHFWGSSLEWISGSSWNRRAWAVRASDDGSGLPVWLVKVDVEGLSPVCKHRLLCDEAVVAPSPAPLVGEIHGALVGPRGLIVMIRHGGMGGGSTREPRREEQRGVKHEKAWKSKCEGGMWKQSGDNYEMGVVGGRKGITVGKKMETGTKKNKKIRRIWTHRCVHYTPSYSSDTRGHTMRFNHMRVSSIWTEFLYGYPNVSNCPLCAARFMWEQH